MKQILNSIFFISLFLLSFSQKKNGSILSKSEVDLIFDEEIDDSELILDVNNSRNETMNLLNLDLIKKMGLKEIYLQEEPLSINFTDQSGNLVSFEAMKIKRSEIDNYLLTIGSDSKNNVKQIVFEDRIIKYYTENSSASKNITSFINCNNSDGTLKMMLYCKTNEDNLINQYSKLMNCIN